MKPSLFFLFNVTFISIIQSILLFAIATPTYALMLVSQLSPTMTTADIIITRSLMALILTEFFADQQQWDYQTAKSAYLKSAKLPPNFTQASLDRGFVTTGLWSWSRHPNFAAEQAIWALLYAWGAYKTAVLYNWTAVGAVSYLVLFQGSTWFTELLTARKYPEYKEYQKRVGRFLPRFGRGFSDSKAKPKVENGVTKKK